MNEPVAIHEVVPAALDGERLDRVVALALDVSRSIAVATIAAGGVHVDGVAATTGKVRLVEGQTVDVDPGAVPRTGPLRPDPDVVFEVVHDDAEVVVVDKPAGLVVHPGAGHADGTLANGLLARYPELGPIGEPDRPGIVHRLDAGSSGLLVIARTESARRHLIEQFTAHTTSREYVALVWGHPDSPHGVIDAPIGRDRRDPVKMAVVADGRAARTEYEVRERFTRPTELALVDCRLETGRTHQIRVHLASIGHPLVGDPIYGERRPVLGLERPFLHAVSLGFDHPGTGERLQFASELPEDLTRMLAGLSA